MSEWVLRLRRLQVLSCREWLVTKAVGRDMEIQGNEDEEDSKALLRESASVGWFGEELNRSFRS